MEISGNFKVPPWLSAGNFGLEFLLGPSEKDIPHGSDCNDLAVELARDNN